MRYYSITMLIGTVLGCIAGIPQLEGRGYALFCISKFIIGSGLATGLMTMQILLQEISHPRQRPIVAAGFNQSWTLGSVLSAWIRCVLFYRETRQRQLMRHTTPQLRNVRSKGQLAVVRSFSARSPCTG